MQKLRRFTVLYFSSKLSVLLREWKIYFAKRNYGLAVLSGSGCTPHNSPAFPTNRNSPKIKFFSVKVNKQKEVKKKQQGKIEKIKINH